MIISMKYHPYPPLRDMSSEMALEAVEFISALVSCIDYTYESLLVIGNIKEDVWWITNRFIRSIFKDYLDPTRSTSTKTSLDSDYQLRSTLIWGVIW